MPPEAPYLDAVEASVKQHLNALAKDNYRRSLDRTSATYDPEAKARASLDRSSRTSTAGKRRRKPRVAKDTAAAVLERLVADAGGVFAFWGCDAWRSTLALEEAVAEALCPTPAPAPPPSPEKLWSLHAAEVGGYAAAAPFAPFSELKKVGPWRPQTPPKPPDPLARVPPDASCSLAVFISAAQRAWLIECARVRDARRAARVSDRAATEAAAKRARRPDAARVPKQDVEDLLEAWARAGWRAPASARTALPAALERLGNAELAEYSLRDLEELLEVVLVDSAGHLDVEHDEEWREDWAWEPWPSQPRPKVKWAKRFLGTDNHDEAKWRRIRSDYASTVMSRMHHTMRRRRENQRSWIFEAPAAYDVVVTVHAAADLPSLDGARGISDPYCILKVGSQTQRTNYVKDDLCPNFGSQTFYFNNTRSTDIVVELMDKDWTQDDEALGVVSVPLLGLGSPPTQHKFELSCVRNLNPGSVTISWHRTPVVKKTEEDDERDVIDLAHYGHRVDTHHDKRRGAVAMAVAAAAKGRRPTLISVRECGLDDRGVLDVVDVLKEVDRSRLKALDLSQNPVQGRLAMGALSAMLRSDYALPELRVLDVSGCRLGARVVEMLAALGGRGDVEDGVDPKAYPLERLALARNKLGDAEGRVLAVAIARNPQLRRVDAAWNGFTPATGALLLEALEAPVSKLEALVVDEACVPRGAPRPNSAAALKAARARKAARRRPHLDRDIYAEPFPTPKRPLLVGDAFRVQARDGLAVVVRA